MAAAAKVFESEGRNVDEATRDRVRTFAERFAVSSRQVAAGMAEAGGVRHPEARAADVPRVGGDVCIFIHES
jgi:hypothetical protein